jgi:hypothetical protein
MFALTPSKAGYLFNPVSVSTNSLGKNLSVNFTGTVTSSSYTISGVVRDCLGAGILGATVTLTGDSSLSAVTGSAGTFSFPALPAGGSYTVSPLHPSYIFSPVNFSTVSLRAGITNLNFTGGLKAKLNFNPASINFGEVKNKTTISLYFVITNSGQLPLTGTITTSGSWIGVSPTTFSGSTIDVMVTVDNKILNQTSGQHSGNVHIESNGGSGDVSVILFATCVLVKPNPLRHQGYGGQAPKLTFFGSGIVPGATTIRIYTLSGELVESLNNIPSPLMGRGQGEGLSNEIPWNGLNSSGEPVSPGIYIYTFESPLEKGVGKFTVIR